MVWTSGPDAGMYDAVNKGMAMARGDVLAYLPSDDVYLPWAIETVVDVFASHPDVDLVYGDGITIEEDSAIQILRLYAPFDRLSLAHYASLLQPAIFWRRRLAENVGPFDTRMRYVADLDYWLRAGAAGAVIAHVNEVIAVERVHAGRQSSAQREAMKREEEGMRASHVGPSFGPEGIRRAAQRYLRWQQRLWLRFVLASTLHPLPGPWHRFLSEGRVTVHRRQALSGLRRRNHQRLRGAMESQLAADILSV
jgi:hypothetical protein